MKKTIAEAHRFPEVGVPFFWPLGFALALEQAALDAAAKNIRFLDEVSKTQVERPRPAWATPNKTVLQLHTMALRDFSRGDGPPVLVLPPYAGHTSTIADFQPGQSLVATLLGHGCGRVWVADWHGATPEMKDYDVDNYLADINVAVDELGGRVRLVGLCQGGWCASMVAARFPAKVERLVIAGAPIDTDAGEGAIKQYAHALPMSFYEALVRTGGGLMKGALMLSGFKNMHPTRQYLEKFAELYEMVDDASYIGRFEAFERWYETTLDLPGAWYLQVIRTLFKENQLAKGRFIALGQTLDLKRIECPVYLLAGTIDDITPPAQVFGAAPLLGTPAKELQQALAAGGHIGLFMGRKVLQQNWVQIAAWLAA